MAVAVVNADSTFSPMPLCGSSSEARGCAMWNDIVVGEQSFWLDGCRRGPGAKQQGYYCRLHEWASYLSGSCENRWLHALRMCVWICRASRYGLLRKCHLLLTSCKCWLGLSAWLFLAGVAEADWCLECCGQCGSGAGDMRLFDIRKGRERGTCSAWRATCERHGNAHLGVGPKATSRCGRR